MMKVSIERATKWSKIHLCFCELSSAPTAALAAARPVFLLDYSSWSKILSLLYSCSRGRQRNASPFGREKQLLIFCSIDIIYTKRHYKGELWSKKTTRVKLQKHKKGERGSYFSCPKKHNKIPVAKWRSIHKMTRLSVSLTYFAISNKNGRL